MVEPAILKAVQGVEQRHVQEAHHLSNGIDGEEANDHTLEGHTTHNTIIFPVTALTEQAVLALASCQEGETPLS